MENKPQYTGGDWQLSPQDDTCEFEIVTRDQLVAKVYGMTEEEARANADLVMAAPKLLRALVNLLASSGADKAAVNLARREAEAAIKEAQP